MDELKGFSLLLYHITCIMTNSSGDTTWNAHQGNGTFRLHWIILQGTANHSIFETELKKLYPITEDEYLYFWWFEKFSDIHKDQLFLVKCISIYQLHLKAVLYG